MITAPKCDAKTTKHLINGDVILDGNIFAGFTTKTFIKSEVSPNKSVMLLTFEINGVTLPPMPFGKNTRWSVISKETN
jgi:hypothetical protein